MELSDKAQISLDKVITKFKSGDISSISKVMRMQLDPKAPARLWSLSNRVLAYVQAQELDCRGYMQWQGIGRSLKHGSKAVYIVRPVTIKNKARATDNDNDEATRICVGFSTFPVFAASDTEGDESLTHYEPTELPPLMILAQQIGITVDYVPLPSDRLGDTNIEGTKIRVGSTNPVVFFHELTHAIHARISGGLLAGQHVDQEVTAELCATVLMDMYSLGDHTGNAWEYIKMYAPDPLTAITKAVSTVEAVLNLIFGDHVLP